MSTSWRQNKHGTRKVRQMFGVSLLNGILLLGKSFVWSVKIFSCKFTMFVRMFLLFMLVFLTTGKIIYKRYMYCLILCDFTLNFNYQTECMYMTICIFLYAIFELDVLLFYYMNLWYGWRLLRFHAIVSLLLFNVVTPNNPDSSTTYRLIFGSEVIGPVHMNCYQRD